MTTTCGGEKSTTRQYRAVEGLLDAGLDPEQITVITGDDVERIDGRVGIFVRDRTAGVPVPPGPITAHLVKAREVDVVTGSGHRLYVDRDGNPIDPADFETVQPKARLARSNVIDQARLRSQLHEARNGVEANGD